MAKQMRVLVVRPGATMPVTKVIDGTLESMQKLVEGYIQCVVLLPGRLVLICNEEGILRSLPYNRRVCGHDIYGTFFLCKPSDDRLVGLSRDDVILLTEGLDWTGEITA